MKELLAKELEVRVRLSNGHETLMTRTVRELILNPVDVHMDDVLNALRLFCATIVMTYEEDVANGKDT